MRSLVFPRRIDVSAEQIEHCIREWAAAGLIHWYETAQDRWISFPQFAKNQRGLRKKREAKSEIPPPPAADDGDPLPAEIRSNAGVDPQRSRPNGDNDPEESRQKRTEIQGKRRPAELPAGTICGKLL